jgi:cell division protein FtsB
MFMSEATRKLGVISAVILAGAATLLFFQHQSIVKLSRDNQALEQQASQLTHLAADNERLSNLVAQTTGVQSHSKEQERELLRLRGEVGRLREQNKDLENLREENRRFRAVLAAMRNSPGTAAATEAASLDYLPKSSWTFVGYATPEASLQSGLWAANSGDVKTFFTSITGEMQATVQNDLEGKSETEARTKVMDEVAKIKSCRIVNREVLSDEEVVLTVSIEEGEQAATTSKLTMKRAANEWKLSATHD